MEKARKREITLKVAEMACSYWKMKMLVIQISVPGTRAQKAGECGDDV